MCTASEVAVQWASKCHDAGCCLCLSSSSISCPCSASLFLCLVSLCFFQLLFPIPTIAVDSHAQIQLLLQHQIASGYINCGFRLLFLCFFLPTSPAVQLQDMHRKVHLATCDKAEFVPAEFFCPACAERATHFVSSHISSSGWAGFCMVCFNELTESFRLVGSS